MASLNGSTYGYHGPPAPRAPAPILPPSSAAPLWYIENERHYDLFRKGKYMFPCDQEEMNRMDIFHKFFLVARQFDGDFGGLYRRQLPNRPRIMDLGCGTGIWAIDMADRHGGRAEILGWDLSLIQPLLIPENVMFERRDIEEAWLGLEEGSRDLIHMSMLAGSIEHWPSLYRQIYRYLKPGTGYLEHVEIDFRPECENGEMPKGSKLLTWSRELTEAMERAGRSMTPNPNTVGVLEQLGYVDVEQVRKRIPFSPWSDDAHEKDMGRWFNLGLTQGLYAMTIAPLTRMNGYNREQVIDLINGVKKEICTRELRAYCTMYVWTARRPSVPGQRA
ncbi:methyltransferase LaeA [Whalleya microplaca]|nr:methyltransferase LaeA [Whalleya microplaca]